MPVPRPADELRQIILTTMMTPPDFLACQEEMEDDQNEDDLPDMETFLKDFRDPDKIEYPLIDLMLIAVMAVIAGANTIYDIRLWLEAHEEWVIHFFEFKNKRIPSVDTFERIFRLLPPETMRRFSYAMVAALIQHHKLKEQEPVDGYPLIAIDGKTMRRTFDKSKELNAVHQVSAWQDDAGLVLGQLQVDDKSNEIPAVEQLVASLNIEGCVITVDAMHCQRKLARQIVDQKGHYLMCVKKNQKELWHYLATLFADDPEESPWQQKRRTAHEHVAQTKEKGHGRIEVRTIRVSDDLGAGFDWPHAKQVYQITRHRTEISTGKQSSQIVYGVSDLGVDEVTAEQLMSMARRHWAVENKLHWRLDVVFREDDLRCRCGHEAENFAILDRLACSIILHDKERQKLKHSVRSTRKFKMSDPDKLVQMLMNLDMDEANLGRKVTRSRKRASGA